MNIKGPVCVIVEGMDRTGKTTLIERIKREIPGPWVTIHNARQPDKAGPLTAIDLYLSQTAMMAKNTRHWYIFDRLHISEAVYSYLYRVATDDVWRFEFALPHNAFIVLCERDVQSQLADEDGASTWSEYGDGDPLLFHAERSVFRRALGLSRLQHIIVDPVEKGDQAMVAIREAIHMAEREVHL